MSLTITALTIMSPSMLWIESSVILCVTALLALAVGRGATQARARLWRCAFLGLALLPLASSLLPKLPLPLLPASMAGQPWTIDRLLVPPAQPGVVDSPTDGFPATAPITRPATDEAPFWRTLWLLGFLALSARTVFELALLAILAHWHGAPLRGRRELLLQVGQASGLGDVDVRVTQQLDVPLTCGWWRPTLLLPPWAATVDDERLRMILLHELAHLKRRDHWLQPVERLVCALYWPNPLVWLGARAALLERERACDATVLRAGADRIAYARLLTDAAGRLRLPRRLATPALTSHPLRQRIVDILQAPESRHSAVSALASPLLIVSTILLLATAEVRRAEPAATAQTMAGSPLTGRGGPLTGVGGTTVSASSTARKTLEQVLIELRHGPRDLRLQAAWALGEREDPRAVDALLQALRDPDPEMRGMAAWALGEIKSPASLAGLLHARHDSDIPARAMIVRAIGELELDSALPEIVEALADPQAEVRVAAVAALGELAEHRPAGGAIEGAASDPDPGVRQAAVRTLAQAIGRSATPVIASALDDPSPLVRGEAAEALGQLGAHGAVGRLVGGLHDSAPQVRALAAQALGRIGDPAAVASLIHATRDPAPPVREWASWAMDEINPNRHL
ncbi:MAG: M56 family metallopeptidase [Acidobacteriota bacterium]